MHANTMATRACEQWHHEQITRACNVNDNICKYNARAAEGAAPATARSNGAGAGNEVAPRQQRPNAPTHHNIKGEH